jgi:hypothetical protein
MLGFPYNESAFSHHNLVDHQLQVGCGYSQYTRSYSPNLGVAFSIRNTMCPRKWVYLTLPITKAKFCFAYEKADRKTRIDNKYFS